MADSDQLRNPWLVAVYPGMGSVALVAAGYLMQTIRARKVHELDMHDFFEVQAVDVTKGIAKPGRLPRGMFFEWHDPNDRHDLLFFVAEAQPAARGYALCKRVVDYAAERGVKRMFTFAAMATQLNPGEPARVFAASTSAAALQEANQAGAENLDAGQISGLNGLMLAAGLERQIDGTCLLGELPYFAVQVPNPTAALVVLRCFAEMAQIQVDLAQLEEQAHAHEEQLRELMETMKAANGGTEQPESEFSESLQPEPQANRAAAEPAPPELDAATQQRIESLFQKAMQDRSKGFELKQELDRLGVFKRYENRFLDLFRTAG